jgi:hypothetical protein
VCAFAVFCKGSGIFRLRIFAAEYGEWRACLSHGRLIVMGLYNTKCAKLNANVSTLLQLIVVNSLK